ncbi:MAG: gamma-glutamyltransferase family protein, partial [Porticoccaceae bacterium]|nr:gamma-glutamyltransferase family protein [Porticoccaceae bacterium]
PAVRLAREGFPVSPVISHLWNKDYQEFKAQLSGAATEHWFSTFTPEGRAPKAGEIFRSEAHARTLESLAQSRCESFYRGELAEKIDSFARETGGLLRKEDLAAYQPEWVDPISVNYRGYDIWEIPPNGQGIVALMALQIANGFELGERESLDSYHQLIEAMKLAYVDGHAYVTQPDAMSVSVEQLLSEQYAAARRAQIGDQALQPEAGDPKAGGTVYLATADAQGNMVSFIQSNYHGFGSGVVIPETGIAMQNRGHNFSLDPEHDNCLAPGKKTFHTIIPGFITKGDQAVGPFGVMGGFMQPQGHMQMVINMLDFGLNPQAALDAPRWQWMGGKKVGLEPSVPEHIVRGLVAKGHEVEIATDVTSYGRGQIVLRDPDSGVLCGATESRTDGHIAAL